jgi:hypothetical protein
MKRLRLILKTKQFKILSIVLTGIVVAIGLALAYVKFYKRTPAGLALDVAGFGEVQPDKAGWGGVRSTATLFRIADAIFRKMEKTLKVYGVDPNVPYTYNGGVAGLNLTSRIRMKSASNPILSTVDSAGVIYQNRIWVTDNLTGGTIIQMFFDDLNNAYAGNGSLLIFKPYYLDNTHTYFSDTGVFEARMKPPGANKIAYFSFSGSPWKQEARSYPVTGRAKMIDNGMGFFITSLVSTHVDGSPEHVTCAHGAGYSFYTLAYISGNKSPFVTTAVWGWNDTSISNTMCGINLFQYGHLNSVTGLDCDGRSAKCPDGYPYPLNEWVNKLYSDMDNTSVHEFNERAIKDLVVPFVDSVTFN